MFVISLWVVLVLMVFSCVVSFVKIFINKEVSSRIQSFSAICVNGFGVYVFLLQLGFFQ